MTGRGAGYCAGFGMPGYANPARGRASGMDFGSGWGFRDRWSAGGRGWRHRFWETGLPGWLRLGPYATPYAKRDPKVERQALKDQAEALQSELDFINKRLSDIEPETARQ